MSTTSVDAGACALFLMATFVLAGCAHVAWLASPWSERFMIPIDGGRTFRGRRLFGANKTVRGFMVMVPATALAFFVGAEVAARGNSQAIGLWTLSQSGYAWLGALAGLGFMLGELPNSFIKRQLDIAPGTISPHRAAAAWQLVADRVDSGLGMLVALNLAVPVPRVTWALVLFVGWTLHWSFSVVLFRLGVKPRHA